MSFNSEYLELRKKRLENQKLTEIGPVKITTTKNDDLGPVDIVKKDNSTDERKWFQKGAFEDGYQFGDVIKTILGSTTDVKENVGAGIIGMGESALDALMMLGAKMNEQSMNQAAQNEMIFNAVTGEKTDVTKVLENYDSYQDEVEKGTAEFIKKDLYDEAAIAKKIITEPAEKLYDIDAETDSVFGEKSDELAQSAGQLLGTSALQAAGVPWWLTTGLTSFGGEAEAALNEGATFDEAAFSATVSAGAEILTEKISGGIKFGGKTLDDALTKVLASNVSNKTLRTLAKFGIDAVGEGNEEILSGLMSAIGKKLTYADEKELNELFSSEDAWDSFIGGAILGGGSSGINIAKAKTEGVDSVTGLTNNEQAVFDKVYNDRIAEATEGGKKLSSKEKLNIYNAVMNDIEKGRISIDTIESVLGGETYKQYQSAVEKDNSMKELQKEYDTLYRMKNGEKSDEQIDRQAELKKQLEEYKNTSNMSQLKEQLSNEVSEFAKNTKLNESYNEKARRSQAFEADLTQYDAKAQETVKRAIDSGILNNTNRTHEFVDLVAKLSADKGVLFDFTNNQKLKESGFAIEGKTVNGYVQGGNIAVNIDSTKALNKVVGHEITHILEGTELYTELQQAVKQYAEAKGEYNTKLQSIAKLYEGIEDANIENEMTADLIGEYLFTDSDFVNSLSAEHPTLFQKIFNEIKYLCKIATAGSKEAKQLEKVKKTFADAYKQKNNTATDDGVKYSFSEKSNGNDKVIVNAIKENVDLISKDNKFSVESETIPEKTTKSQYVYNIFKEQGGLAENSKIGTVELTNAGAKSTVFHGFGNEKLAAVRAIKSVIENGDIIQETPNYENNGVDRIILAAKGTINNAPAYVGVIVRRFYNAKTSRNSFYLHEALIEKTDSHIMTGPQLSGDTVSESVFSNSISNSTENVKKNSLSDDNQDIAPVGNNNVYGEDVRLEAADDIAPVGEDIAPSADTVEQTTTPEDIAPIEQSAEYINTTRGKIPIEEYRDIVAMQMGFDSYVDMYNQGYRLGDGYDIAPGTDTVENSLPDDYAPTAEDIKKQNTLTNIDVPDLFVKPIKAEAEQTTTPEDIAHVEQSAETTETVEEKPKSKRFERAVRKIDTQLEQDKADLQEDFQEKKAELEKALENQTAFVSDKALSLYKELRNLRKGVRASNDLAYFLDLKLDWNELKSTLLKVSKWPDTVLNAESEIESIVREAIGRDFEEKFYELDDLDTEYQKQIETLEKKAEEKRKKAGIAEQRRVKQQEYKTQMDELIGDTTTWKDKKLGIQYQINTLRRNLRDIVRDKNGKRDIAKADAIYDELQGQYNHNEAELNREANRIKQTYAEMNINKVEDQYIQMLGEYRHNPDTKLTIEEMQEFLEKNRDKIDEAKVDKVIDLARETYDSLFGRVNSVLKEQGMREIPYRLGYFPHFTEEKQGRLAKLLNWKTHKTDIPTDIAGLTEQFNPNRSWQSFNKQRSGDDTDYSFMKGLDAYVQGALDWIYHIEDIQKRRAFENHIRYVHSEKGIQERIDAIYNNEEYDADEMQEQVDAVFKEAGNPLNNFVTDFRTQTNTLAGKKSSMDRGMEAMLSRDVYSTMTNISNRVTANMVVGSVSSALTNFIPITQSWGQVSPISSLKAMKDTIKSTIQDDGTIDKSDFLTNRLKKSENLYKTTWDKVIDKAGFMMEAIDSFTSQTVWRSKYLENISKGMGENEAIKNADQFAENVLAGRSRGNNPTIFDSKNPLIKTMTAFQLEVNNQYGYMFKDMPQDLKNESAAKLAKGYAIMFIGAYVYNAAYSALTGRDAAIDPIGIIQELLGDLFDDEEDEPADVIMDFTDNVLEEVPFVGGLIGGGRIPISSALPYDDGIYGAFEGIVTDVTEGNWGNLTKEMGESFISYLLLPAGGGQIKKTVQGLSMFDDDLPIAGSYTDSGKLRFSVEETMEEMIKAGIFGQYASSTARQYFDEERAPLSDKKTQELKGLDISIEEYWEYQDGLKALGDDATLAEKIDYIADLEEFDTWQKNIMANNLTDRKESIDLTGYEDIGDFEEFDYATKNPEKYAVAKAVGGYSSYKVFSSDLHDIKADKDANGDTISGSRKIKVASYINNLDIEYGEKLILYKSEYKSDDTYNYQIIEYLNGRDDISREEMETILTELGFTVYADGRVTW